MFESIKNFEDEDEIDFATVNLDTRSNLWLGVRFNIKKMPYIILIENKKMYTFEEQFETPAVLKFIENEKNLENSLEVPENFGIWQKTKAIMNEFHERLKITMIYTFNKFGIKINWTYTKSYIFVFVFASIIVFIENQIIIFIRDLCGFGKNNNHSNTKENIDTKKDEIDNKKKHKKE